MASGRQPENGLPMVQLKQEYGQESVPETSRSLYSNLIEDAQLQEYTPIFPTAPSYPETPILQRACYSSPYYIVPIEDSLPENNGHEILPPPPFNPAFTNSMETHETALTEGVYETTQDPDPYLVLAGPPKSTCCSAMKIWLTIAVTMITVAIIIRVHQQEVEKLLKTSTWDD